MEEVKDKCAFCGKEFVIKDKDVTANLKHIKWKHKSVKLYCSSECRQKANHPVDGSLDVGSLFS